MTATEQDLVDLLRLEAQDVSHPDDLVLRRSGPVRPAARWRRTTGELLAAAAVAVLILVVSTAGPAHRQSAPRNPPAAPRPAASPAVTGPAGHLTLAPSSEYAVSVTAVLPGREVVYVRYRPGPDLTYEGGTITLYQRSPFPGTPFLTTAEKVGVAGRTGYFGVYDHSHVLAWPVSRGRWVAVTGVHGDDADPRALRSVALDVAGRVRVS